MVWHKIQNIIEQYVIEQNWIMKLQNDKQHKN